MTGPIENQPKNLDIQCLRCGAGNIPENRVCGGCGANLPLIYDEEGKIFSPRDLSRQWETAPGPLRLGVRLGLRGPWLLRIGLLLFALAVAFWILHH